MKRYIIKFNLHEGLEIRRYDGFFKEPFVIRIKPDEQGFLPTKTASRLQFLLWRMEKLEKADKVAPRPAPNTAIWIIDVIDGLAVGQYLPYGNKAPAVLLPTMDMIQNLK
jgi:hypothetical protein